MDDLTKRVHALPQELYDHIYAEVFTSTKVIKIDRDWLPPSEMQVDRTARKLFAQSYYADETTFEIHDDFWKLFRWLESLTEGDLTRLGKIVYFQSTTIYGNGDEFPESNDPDGEDYQGYYGLDAVCVEKADGPFYHIEYHKLARSNMRFFVMQNVVTDLGEAYQVCCERLDPGWIVDRCSSG
ncbi:hypothetical protein LTR37_013152 [Vermiconidia calcicola]|uniref:Uncharacterized protein n=1 Tax=Vermiconidia calcicola TaxID=1690605 RepID=A0ACC3MXV6_9PEZI|nr:hypothetical protein LTR37_013152 [Vermiconidia calcicola]